ncbi:MAG: 50S ribosomal protein L6 [Nitrospirales bacterium]|nr:50S ribosomal protein L6 [Nitrospira sp.]MDR4500375.1 50S ribosomal protein L6 [Nitrospirales bacterium]
MSRVGRKPIPIPSQVEVQVSQKEVAVKGPLGRLIWGLPHGVQAKVEDGHVHVSRVGGGAQLRALHGLTRAEISNQIEGVVNGYERTLELTGVGYRAQIQGQALTFNVGYSHPVLLNLPEGIRATVDKQTVVSLKGIDKRLVTQVAAEIRRVKSPDVYKQKGIKYAGEVLRKKAGKAGKK